MAQALGVACITKGRGRKCQVGERYRARVEQVGTSRYTRMLSCACPVCVHGRGACAQNAPVVGQPYMFHNCLHQVNVGAHSCVSKIHAHPLCVMRGLRTHALNELYMHGWCSCESGACAQHNIYLQIKVMLVHPTYHLDEAHVRESSSHAQ